MINFMKFNTTNNLFTSQMNVMEFPKYICILHETYSFKKYFVLLYFSIYTLSTKSIIVNIKCLLLT